ncbi:hypothetical protein SODALDRAFT_95610 [Sodiomyces alkalinus F11]|uniref:Secreted protein n=1 Tax=Sodiomyces alkalinus (strain CBS 110278 / VKM F-3762 / F11) TaxID=1314773 RepID=A0A3N2Q0V7_SODAK|nr:hypothetical protein SODALDRAFT_95610 [Sodiomyces alkalinus F11]ROT40391.1 hypothetical protein SODALDRAFT_95610 [Sodiomyces alkalinus F11]
MYFFFLFSLLFFFFPSLRRLRFPPTSLSRAARPNLCGSIQSDTMFHSSAVTHARPIRCFGLIIMCHLLFRALSRSFAILRRALASFRWNTKPRQMWLHMDGNIEAHRHPSVGPIALEGRIDGTRDSYGSLRHI